MAAKISLGTSEPAEDSLQNRQPQPPKPVSRPGKYSIVIIPKYLYNRTKILLPAKINNIRVYTL